MLTTISTVRDITGSWIGGTFCPCFREVLLAMDTGFVFLHISHPTRGLLTFGHADPGHTLASLRLSCCAPFRTALATARISSSIQKIGVGGYTEEVLEWFNYPAQAPIPDAKLAPRVYRIGLHRRFARASSRPARRWRSSIVVTKLRIVRRL